ncbi:MAG: GlsB/YeaQ/YmgE family stress response membrane protein [Betaproteobacteria bacterium]|nr:GlsB/YeaQ/YmgE family stress response membrane protein [Betaproteobacteria bacterium]
MSYVWMVVIGFVAGLIARALHPGDDKLGLILTAVLGIAGSLLANFVGQALGWYGAGETAGFIASVIGAIVLLAIYSMVKKRSGTSGG